MEIRLNGIEILKRRVSNWGAHATAIRPGAFCYRVHEEVAELKSRDLRQLKEEAEPTAA